VLGPETGYSFFKPDGSDINAEYDLSATAARAALHSVRLGVLGTSRFAGKIARTARQEFDSDVVCCASVPGVDARFDAHAQRQALAEVLKAHVLCVVLPFPDEMALQLEAHRSTVVNPHAVLVAWRRSPAIERALTYIGQHYVEPVQLSSLAQVAGVSKYHFVRLFSATLGTTPHRYQLLLRLSRAKSLLREGIGITQIAHGLGFADHSHLNRSFRILLGMTPTQ
jgi:AraC-like DNA-binding protein